MPLIYFLICLIIYSPVLFGNVLVANPENYRSKLSQLKPGDHLNLKPGVYTRGLPVHNVNGLKSAPIVISGPVQTSGRAVLLGKRGRNTISIVNSSHIVIKQLTLDGQRQPVDGVKAEGYSKWAHHITLEGLVIKNFDNNQQKVGISTKCPAWNWVIRNNIIDNVGTGIYLGDSDGSDSFVAGLIENNVIKNTIGYNLQIKHQIGRSSELLIGSEPQNTIIRDNIFTKSANSSSGGMSRPNVLVGHWPLEGPGKNDRYLIYRNFFYDNPSEALFQAEGNVTFYNNVLVNRYGPGIRIQPHNDEPRDVVIFYNTVLSPTTGISIKTKDNSRFTQPEVFRNLVFATHPIVGGQSFFNGEAALFEAGSYLTAPFKVVNPDLHPSQDLTDIVVQKKSISIPLLEESVLDFDGRLRQTESIGAYSRGEINQL